jgi:hypothetical protein
MFLQAHIVSTPGQGFCEFAIKKDPPSNTIPALRYLRIL